MNKSEYGQTRECQEDEVNCQPQKLQDVCQWHAEWVEIIFVDRQTAFWQIWRARCALISSASRPSQKASDLAVMDLTAMLLTISKADFSQRKCLFFL